MRFSKENSEKSYSNEFDVVIVGAGFSGLYMLHSLREAGFTAKVIEAAEGVGGVWYWNRYPGARCDIDSIAYNYLFSEELFKEWDWTSKYPSQPEILNYLNYVTDKLDLRKDISFNTEVKSAQYNDESGKWQVYTNNGSSVTGNYFIPAVGGLSAANIPNFKGRDKFEGEMFHTSDWPKEKVEFQGKRVGVIGTGSTGTQVIPLIAKEAEHLTVFQRTPQFTLPARNYNYEIEFSQEVKKNIQGIRNKVRSSSTGDLREAINKGILEMTEEERLQKLEESWKEGGFIPRFSDIYVNEEANEIVAEFLRSKIYERVNDPKLAEKLVPNYFFGTKRIVLETDYLETYNRENVELVDVKSAPIQEITSKGLQTTDGHYDLDVLVFATGYDAITGPLFKLDIRGKNGLSLREKWDNGGAIKTYLGLATNDFPNMFFPTGPESPAGLANNVAVIEYNVEWITECIKYAQEHELNIIEADEASEEEWSNLCRAIADATLFVRTESWWTGANIADKPKGFPLYVGGLNNYIAKADEVANKKYEGFSLFSMKVKG